MHVVSHLVQTCKKLAEAMSANALSVWQYEKMLKMKQPAKELRLKRMS